VRVRRKNDFPAFGAVLLSFDRRRRNSEPDPAAEKTLTPDATAGHDALPMIREPDSSGSLVPRGVPEESSACGVGRRPAPSSGEMPQVLLRRAGQDRAWGRANLLKRGPRHHFFEIFQIFFISLCLTWTLGSATSCNLDG